MLFEPTESIDSRVPEAVLSTLDSSMLFPCSFGFSGSAELMGTEEFWKLAVMLSAMGLKPYLACNWAIGC